MTTITSSNTGIILTPQERDVTIIGTITGNLPAGQYAYAAVQGGAETNFNILNLGTILSLGDAEFASGLFLADPGQLTNQGTIAGQSGILIFTADPGAYIQNNGLIQGRGAYGVYLQAAGGLNNTGIITGAAYGIYLGGGGAVANSGTIAGAYGIYTAAPTQLTNNGLIRATKYTGAAIQGVLTNQQGALVTGPTAIALAANASAINYGLIQGADTGIAAVSSAAIYNYGTITGATAIAGSGAYTYNGATVTGTQTGIQLSPSGVLINAATGTIAGNTGIDLTAGASVINASVINYGLIRGAVTGIAGIPQADIYNYGVITGLVAVSNAGTYTYNGATIAGTQTGIQLTQGGQLINAATGTISGATALSVGDGGGLANYGRIAGGITGSGAGTNLYNYSGGLITAASDAISLSAGANIYNTGIIIGGATAIAVSGGIIANYNTIAGTGYAIAAAPSSNTTLFLYPTARISGQVYLGGGALNLLAGPTSGTISSAQFTGLDEITLAQGALWNLSGAFTEAVINNNGTIETSPTDSLTVFVVSGAGTLVMPQNLAITGLATYGEDIAFTGTNQTLQITSPELFYAQIDNFTAGDIIDLTTLALSDITGETFANNFLTISEATASQYLAIDLAPGEFGTPQLFTDGAGIGITLSNPFTTPTTQAWSSTNPTVQAFAPLVTNSFNS